VKRLELVATLEGLLDYTVQPNFRALGPKVGKALPRVKELLAAADGAAIRRALDADGSYPLDVDGETVVLGPDDVQIRASSHEELALAQAGERAVALDTTLDDGLRAEGHARELVRVVNDQRKAQGFEISDRIRLTVDAAEPVLGAVQTHAEWIAGEVLAVDLVIGPGAAAPTEVTVDGHPVAVTLERATA
jgi:isoleucyl-tRNA synthetase